MSVGLIIVAGGSGTRFRAANDVSGYTDTKKQYIALNEKPIFIHTLSKFIGLPGISEIVIVCPADDIPFVEAETKKFYPLQKNMKFVSGGSERVYSVINGFSSISDDVDMVMIHDAVRPFIEKDTIFKAIKETEITGAAIVAVPVKDTIKLSDDSGVIERTVDRSKLFAAQTPQVFKRDVFKSAIENWRRKGEPAVTDDAMMIEMICEPVKLVVGSYKNIKITKPEDISVAKGILNSQKENL